MLTSYPKKASSLESAIQLVILISLLAFAGLYSTLKASAPEPDAADRIAIMWTATKINGVAFLLAVSASFLRRATKDAPLLLIWGGVLGVALVAWVMACLILLSAL